MQNRIIKQAGTWRSTVLSFGLDLVELLSFERKSSSSMMLRLVLMADKNKARAEIPECTPRDFRPSLEITKL